MQYFKRENRVVFHVKDYDACVRFYKDGLELEPYGGWDYGPDDRGLKFKNRGMDLEVIQRDPPVPQGPTTIMLEALNVDTCYAAMLQKPYMKERVIEAPADRHYGIRVFRMMDPNGNDVVIYENNDPALAIPSVFRVQIKTNRYEELCEFYGEKLGFLVAVRRESPGDRVRVYATAGGEIELIEVSEPFFIRADGLLVQIEVRDVDACYAGLLKAGVPVLEAPEDRFYGHRDFRVKDPQGLTLKFFTPIKS